MSVTLDQIDPRAIGANVADLLQRAWVPPCLWYSPEYLQWEFAVPGRRPAVAFGAFEDAPGAARRLVGFIGAVPRRACVGEWIGDVWLLSFVAVTPERRRRGIAHRLYAEFFSVANGTPVVIFTRPNSPGEHLRRACLAATSCATHTLRVCRTYGGVASSTGCDAGHASCIAEPVTDYETWMHLLLARPPRVDRLAAWPDALAFDHYRRDPRGRTFYLVRDANGRPIAGAAAFHAETRRADGPLRTPSIECVVLHETTPSAVATVVHAAFEIATSPTSPAIAATTPTPPRIVLLPNVSTIDETLLRPAGLRATRSQFLAHLTGPAGHPALAASSTNIEVV